MKNCTTLYSSIYQSAEYKAVFGYIKMCTKPMPPGSKLAKSEKKEEKKEEKKKEVAPKKEAGGDDDAPAKKPKSELDLLPPTPFDLFNFKTFFVNHPDKGG